MVAEARGSWFKKRVSRVGRSREAENWPSCLRMPLVTLNLFLSWPVLAFRKESYFFQKLTDIFSDLMLTPTILQWHVDLGVDDYGLKGMHFKKVHSIKIYSFQISFPNPPSSYQRSFLHPAIPLRNHHQESPKRSPNRVL